MNTLRKILMLTLIVIAALTLQVFSASPGRSGSGATGGEWGRDVTPTDNAPRTLTPYFTQATSGSKAPDADGFLQRWMLLEPISNGLRTNTGFNEAYIRNAFNTESFQEAAK